MALAFYYKDMVEKVTMQRTQQFSAFLVPQGRVEYLTKCNRGRLRPEVQPLTLLCTILAEMVPLLYTICSNFAVAVVNWLTPLLIDQKTNLLKMTRVVKYIQVI